MAGIMPISPGSPIRPAYTVIEDFEDSMMAAGEAPHISDSDLPFIGFSNGLPGYVNACFRNALLSLLVNILPFAGWIASDAHGQLSTSPTARLLENIIREYFSVADGDKQVRADTAVQRLYNRLNIAKPVQPKNLKGRFDLDTQQDAVEVLQYLLEDILEELHGNVSAKASFSALCESSIVAKVKCASCGRATSRHNPVEDEPSWSVIRTLLTQDTTTFQQLVDTAFMEEINTNMCSRCDAVQPRDLYWTILRPAEVLFIDINQVTTAGVKPGFKVPPIPRKLNFQSRLHLTAVINGVTAEYQLVGVVNHSGRSAYSGHYTSHVRDIRGDWHYFDDSTVKKSSLAELQKYNPRKKNRQPIPRLAAYVRTRKDESALTSVATRPKGPHISPKPFLHTQIVPIASMTTNQLKSLCRDNGLNTNAKKLDSIHIAIEAANSSQSNFATRSKEWLIHTLADTGVLVDPSASKTALAAQLRLFMSMQPVPDSVPRSDSKDKDKPPAKQQDIRGLRTALEAARTRITELEQTVADLQASLATAEAKRNSRSSSGVPPPRVIDTDRIRELVRQLPMDSPRVGTKRGADDGADEEPEAKKRRHFHLVERMCAALDAGQQLTKDVYTQTDRNPSIGQSNGHSEHASAGGHRDSSQENRQHHSNDQSSRCQQSTASGRCHRCPQFPEAIHHLCAQVCGMQHNTQYSPPTASEQADEDRQIMERYGEVRYQRFSPPTRRPPYPRPQFDVTGWDLILYPGDPTQIMAARPVTALISDITRQLVISAQNAGGGGGRDADGSPSLPSTASPELDLSQAGFTFYVPTPQRMRQRKASGPEESASEAGTSGSEGFSPLTPPTEVD